MTRGDLWLMHGLSGDRHVLIVGNDALTETSGSVLTVPVETELPITTSLVTVRITEPIPGIARAHGVAPIRKERLAQRIGTVDQATMDMIDAALRTALDL